MKLESIFYWTAIRPAAKKDMILLH